MKQELNDLNEQLSDKDVDLLELPNLVKIDSLRNTLCLKRVESLHENLALEGLIMENEKLKCELNTATKNKLLQS